MSGSGKLLLGSASVVLLTVMILWMNMGVRDSDVAGETAQGYRVLADITVGDDGLSIKEPTLLRGKCHVTGEITIAKGAELVLDAGCELVMDPFNGSIGRPPQTGNLRIVGTKASPCKVSGIRAISVEKIEGRFARFDFSCDAVYYVQQMRNFHKGDGAVFHPADWNRDCAFSAQTVVLEDCDVQILGDDRISGVAAQSVSVRRCSFLWNAEPTCRTELRDLIKRFNSDLSKLFSVGELNGQSIIAEDCVFTGGRGTLAGGFDVELLRCRITGHRSELFGMERFLFGSEGARVSLLKVKKSTISLCTGSLVNSIFEECRISIPSRITAAAPARVSFEGCIFSGCSLESSGFFAMRRFIRKNDPTLYLDLGMLAEGEECPPQELNGEGALLRRTLLVGCDFKGSALAAQGCVVVLSAALKESPLTGPLVAYFCPGIPDGEYGEDPVIPAPLLQPTDNEMLSKSFINLQALLANRGTAIALEKIKKDFGYKPEIPEVTQKWLALAWKWRPE